MPTPSLYTNFSSSADRLSRPARWYLIGSVCAIAFTPAILDRFYPVFGPIPERTLFVFMVGCLAVNAPLVLFAAPLNRGNASIGARAWGWFLAIVCDYGSLPAPPRSSTRSGTGNAVLSEQEISCATAVVAERQHRAGTARSISAIGLLRSRPM